MNEERIKRLTIEDFNKMADANEMVEEPTRCYGILMDKMDRNTESVLDVGCGLGSFLELLSEKFENVKSLNGVDLTPNMVAKAKEKLGDKAEIKEGDVENLPYQDNTFDVVTCMHSFHHYPSPSKAVSEMYRVLKPGGTLMIVDNYLPGIRRHLYNFRQFITFYHKGDIRFYSLPQMEKLMNEQKFANVSCELITKKSFLCKGTK